jgi:hypothetical protein
MKKIVFAAVLLLLAVRGAQAAPEFKAYAWANYGSPFTYVPTKASDLTSALNGGVFPLGGEGPATLDELFAIGQTSWADEYDTNSQQHVAFSASAVSRPPEEPLSGEAPGIGAKAAASNTATPGAATIIGESYAYLKDTLVVNNPSNRDEFMKSYTVTLSLDGAIHTSGDAIVQVGEAIRVIPDGKTLDDDLLTYTRSHIDIFQSDFGGLLNDYHFGQPGHIGDPIKLTSLGPYGTEIFAHGTHSMTIETLLYVRAQTGGLERKAGNASADFSSTLRVSNIQFFDENDQVIPGLQIVGSNGDVYPYNVVPEPSMLALFGVGSSGLLFARLRRTRRS